MVIIHTEMIQLNCLAVKLFLQLITNYMNIMFSLLFQESDDDDEGRELKSTKFEKWCSLFIINNESII